MYCVPLPRFTKPLAFVWIVGIEPVPFSIISKTISNPLVTFSISESSGVSEDVI